MRETGLGRCSRRSDRTDAGGWGRVCDASDECPVLKGERRIQRRKRAAEWEYLQRWGWEKSQPLSCHSAHPLDSSE